MELNDSHPRREFGKSRRASLCGGVARRPETAGMENIFGSLARTRTPKDNHINAGPRFDEILSLPPRARAEFLHPSSRSRRKSISTLEIESDLEILRGWRRNFSSQTPLPLCFSLFLLPSPYLLSVLSTNTSRNSKRKRRQYGWMHMRASTPTKSGMCIESPWRR